MPRGRALPGGSGVAQANVWGQPDRKTRGRESFNFYRFQKATLDTLGLAARARCQGDPAWRRQMYGASQIGNKRYRKLQVL